MMTKTLRLWAAGAAGAAAIFTLAACADDNNAGAAPKGDRQALETQAMELAQTTGDAQSVTPFSSEAPAGDPAASSQAIPIIDLTRPPEMTLVSGQLYHATGESASGGAAYFLFQSRLNEISHENPLEKAIAMAEAAAPVDTQGSFTLLMKPGNFALIYDPDASTDDLTIPGPGSITSTKRLAPEQIQAKIAAIKQNAAVGLPIDNGMMGRAYVVENRYIRPPVSNFRDIQLQSTGTVTIQAVTDGGGAVEFPATLRLRGKNGDIMEPHTPSVEQRGQYVFYDLFPQSYQVFALGSLPRPGAGDEITTPSVTNDAFIYTGEVLDHEVILAPGAPAES